METELVKQLLMQAPGLALMYLLFREFMAHLEKRDTRDAESHKAQTEALRGVEGALGKLEAVSNQQLGYLQRMAGNGLGRKESGS